MSASGGPAHYEIRVEGVLNSRWAGWFDGLQVSGKCEETVNVLAHIVPDRRRPTGLRLPPVPVHEPLAGAGALHVKVGEQRHYFGSSGHGAFLPWLAQAPDEPAQAQAAGDARSGSLDRCGTTTRIC